MATQDYSPTEWAKEVTKRFEGLTLPESDATDTYTLPYGALFACIGEAKATWKELLEQWAPARRLYFALLARQEQALLSRFQYPKTLFTLESESKLMDGMSLRDYDRIVIGNNDGSLTVVYISGEFVSGDPPLFFAFYRPKDVNTSTDLAAAAKTVLKNLFNHTVTAHQSKDHGPELPIDDLTLLATVFLTNSNFLGYTPFKKLPDYLKVDNDVGEILLKCIYENMFQFVFPENQTQSSTIATQPCVLTPSRLVCETLKDLGISAGSADCKTQFGDEFSDTESLIDHDFTDLESDRDVQFHSDVERIMGLAPLEVRG